MVTKGYRKGVYERVTLGIRGRHRRLGWIQRYKDDDGSLVQMGYGAGTRGRVTLPMRDWIVVWRLKLRPFKAQS
jgi:hypothetical protein